MQSKMQRAGKKGKKAAVLKGKKEKGSISKQKTPFFLISKKKALENYRLIKRNCDLVSYSSKTNQEITKILEKNTNCLFSVHFENELKHLKQMHRVIFLAQAWDKKMIKRLIKKGITKFIVDNSEDLAVFLDFLEGHKGKKLGLWLRLKLKELTIKTERYYVFGMGAGEINKSIQEIADNSSYKLSELGIHFHRKTQNISEWGLKKELAAALEKKTLDAITSINIGGGFPSEYANTNYNAYPAIFRQLKQLRQWLSKKGIKLIAEPGRAIAASATELHCTAIAINKSTIIVDASVYNSDMDALIVPVKLLVKGELKHGQGKPYVIKGITPCSLDLFRYRVWLDKPKKGDRIVFMNAGAYNFTTDFCDLKKIRTIITS